jgi:acyl-CoA dehydrogenase
MSARQETRTSGVASESADTIAQITEAVAALCARFPGEYWRTLDRERRYPTDFVKAMTDAGYLGVLVPEEYGGSGLGLTVAAQVLETVHASGGNAAALHAQMYTMGTLLRHGSQEQKAHWLPRIARGEIRLQAFGVTEPTRAPTRPRSRRRHGGTATPTSSTARKSGSRARSIPT